MTDGCVIAIDGPAGAGKSTIAKRLSQRLGFQYLDTGAMYRSLAFKAMRHGVDFNDEQALVALASETVIDLQGSVDAGVRVLLDGEDVSEAIRTPEITNATFYVARFPHVRAVMVEWQRQIGHRNNVVIEGRDIGTVVFPNAQYKFYLDADLNERARRRYNDFQEQGKHMTLQQVLEDVQSRDEKDLTRAVGPLKKAHDAIVIDSTRLGIDEVVNVMADHVQHGH